MGKRLTVLLTGFALSTLVATSSFAEGFLEKGRSNKIETDPLTKTELRQGRKRGFILKEGYESGQRVSDMFSEDYYRYIFKVYRFKKGLIPEIRQALECTLDFPVSEEHLREENKDIDLESSEDIIYTRVYRREDFWY